MGNSESKTELKREVDAAEVAKHAHKQDCWIIINDIVYDATSFLEDHPGGPSIIMIHAGKDCTTDFEEMGHSDGAVNQLKKLAIAKLKK